MWRERRPGSAWALGLLISGWVLVSGGGGTRLAAAPSFAYRLEAPGVVDAAPGEEVTFSVDATIEQRAVAGPEDGVEAWSMALVVEGEGFEIVESSLLGEAAAIDPLADPPPDPPPEGEGWAHLETSGQAVLLAAIVDLGDRRTLPADETSLAVLRVRVRGRIPAGEDCRSCRVRFLDGVQGSGLPVTNVVTSGGRSYRPILGDRTVRLHPSPCGEGEVVALGDDPVAVEIPDLSACRREACVRFTAGAGRKVLARLAGASPLERYRLLARRGGPVEPGAFDVASRGVQAEPSLLIPRVEEGVYHVHVIADRLAVAPSSLRLLIEHVDVHVDSLSTRRGARGQVVHVGVTGAGFRQGETLFELEPVGGGSPVVASEVRVVSSERADVAFDLTRLEAGAEGLHDLVARRDPAPVAVSSRLPDAFEVMPPAFAWGLGVEIRGHRRYGYDRDSRLTIRYTNLLGREMPAPLLRLRLPAGNHVGLVGEPGLRPERVLLVGASPEGEAGVLPPGVTGEVPVVFRSRERPGEGSFPLRATLELLTPPELAAAEWALQPTPPGAGRWEEVRDRLSGWLGDRWGDYARELAGVSTRIGRRGGEAASARRLFREVYARALGLPTSAIVGRVLTGAADRPAARARVAAIDGEGLEAAWAVTDGEGAFALERLRPSASYRLVVAGSEVEQTLETPDGDDLLGVELRVGAYDAVLVDPDPDPEDPDLPEAPFEPPDEYFTPIGEFAALVVSAIDPNDKEENVTDILGLVSDEEVEYRISFENTGRVPAQRVEIIDQLGEVLDPTSIRLREVSFGGWLLSLDHRPTVYASGPGWASGYDGRTLHVEMPVALSLPGFPQPVDLRLDVDVTLPDSGRTLTWELQTVDPLTGEAPENVDVGFLPPEDGTGRGQGHVAFSVLTDPQAADEGVEVVNDATIRFDQQDPIPTGTVNLYTTNPSPLVPALPVPASGGRLLATDALAWSPSPYAAVTFDVTLWREGEEAPIAERSALRSSAWEPRGLLEPDTGYLWQVTARNARGRTESPEQGDVAPGPVWSFRTYPPLPGPPRGLAVEAPESASPTFRWITGSHATSSALYIARVGEPWPEAPVVILPCAPGVLQEHTLAAGLEDPGASRRCRVDARNDRAPGGYARSRSAVVMFPPPPPPPPPPGSRFVRGDADASGGNVNITDGIYVLNFLFLGGPEPPCLDAADADGSGRVNITDGIYVLNFLFLGGPPPPPPYPGCGVSLGGSALGCERYESCPIP